jgi:hypothetical protein
MAAYRCLYAEIPEDYEYSKKLMALWSGGVKKGDPLYQFHENGSIGEAIAFGTLPHFTILDALTIENTERFTKIIKQNVDSISRPEIRSQGELILNQQGGLLLKAKCSEELLAFRMRMISETSDLVARTQLTDDEFQKAEARIRKIDHDEQAVKANLDVLWKARSLYMEAGKPAIPTSRFFRLPFLVRLIKQSLASELESKVKEAQRSIDFYLKNGLPSWYVYEFPIHTTIVSAIKIDSNVDRNQVLPNIKKSILPVINSFSSFSPAYLSILAEDPEKKFKIRKYDWLTDTFVYEHTFGYKAIDKAYFKSE